MQLLTIALATLIVAGTAFAAPTPAVDVSKFGMDTSGLFEETFTASDGLNHTVWVAKGFRSDPYATDLVTRQKIPNLPTWDGKDTHQNMCRKSSFIGDVGPHAPTTGRCRAIRDWAAKNKGKWSIGWRDITPHQYLALIHDGDCYFAVYHKAIRVRVGNTDVRDMVNDSLNKFQKKVNGAWRVRARGSADCNGDLVENGSAELLWRLTDREHI